ncbi:MAG: hypothetical protein WBB23_13335 [Desulforhopalus sp.]
MWKLIMTEGRWDGEIWNRRKDGDLYRERMTVSMVRDADGEPARYVSYSATLLLCGAKMNT